MKNGFDACATTLSGLLRPMRVFNIPAFQRPYSWTTDEAGQLLDDLLLAFDELDATRRGGGHFLGPIVLLQCEGPEQLVALDSDHDDGTPCAFHIIDGQQRLATLTILVCVLRDLTRTHDGDALPELDALIACRPDLNERDRFRLQMRGITQQTMAAYIQSPGATLLEAPREGRNESEVLLLATRDHFVEVLRDRDVETLERMAAFIINDCDIAAAVTNDVDRAHRIFSVLNNRGRPLSRCDIICAELMDDAAGETLDRLQHELEQLSDRLGTAFDMLFSHIRAAIGDARAPVIADIQRLAVEAGGGARFIHTILMPFGVALAEIQATNHHGSPWSAEINRYLHHLSWLPSGEWVPPALLWWTRHRDDPKMLAVALRRLDRLAFGMRVLGLGADKRQARMQYLRAAIEKGLLPTDEGRSVDLTSEELRNIRHNLRDLHRRSQLTCKLVLMRLDSEVSGDVRLNAEDLTVEHILPQKPARNSRWRDWFSDAEEREACTGSLGNLALVPRALNERARNQEYDRKLAIFFAADGPPLPRLTEELRGTTGWNAALVRAREERMMAMLDAMWHLSKSANPGGGSNGDIAEAGGRSRRNRKPPAVEPPPPH